MPRRFARMPASTATVDTRPPDREPAACAVAPDAGCCYHCGKPNAEPMRWRAVLNGAPREFCCAGCLGIAQTIHVAGLDAFYDRRTAVGDRPVPSGDAPDEWSHWDDAAGAGGLVRTTPDGQREVSLLLEGIHCGACIWLVETWLSRHPGVVHASVNFATRRARVVFDPAVTHLSDVLRAVVSIGYHAYPYDPARREMLVRRESRTLLLRLAVALLAMMQVMMFAVPTYVTVDGVEPAHRLLLEWASLTLTLPSLLYSAAPFFRGAWRDLAIKRPGMDVPVALGLAAAFGASVWATFRGEGAVYYDSVTMFIALLLLARYVELVARRRAGDAVEAVARARPASAERLVAWPARRDVESVGAAALAEGDIVLVRPGGTIPADGTVVEGRGNVEEAILTGESRPRTRGVGDPVLAGCVARDTALVIRVTAAGEATRLAAVLRLVERAASERPRLARVADRIATWFVGALLALAAIVAIAWSQHDPARVLAVTFAVLVVSCPCALSLATPAALAAAAGALARRQVVVARADALETLARVTHVVFDKTGTLTLGHVALLDTQVLGSATRDGAVALAAALEAQSEHPLARAFRAAGAGLELPCIKHLQAVAGHGVEGVVAGRIVRLGRPDFVGALSGQSLPAAVGEADPAATLVALGRRRRLHRRFCAGRRPSARRARVDHGAARAGHCSNASVWRSHADGRDRGRGARHRRRARRRAARGQAGGGRRAAGGRRRGGDGGRWHQRRAVAGAGTGLGEPRQRDAARAMDRRCRRAVGRSAADRRRDCPRAPDVARRVPESRVGGRLQRHRHPCGRARVW